MALYTRKGDDGATQVFGCDQRISKSSAVAEALGVMDEVNSYLGICKVKAKEARFMIGENSFSEIIHNIQQNLFIVQAELAGATESISEQKVKEIEEIIDGIEKEIPKVSSFFISGSTELSAMFDFARTLARRAERRVVAVYEGTKFAYSESPEGNVGFGKHTLQYLNRLSSLLYALARLSCHLFGIKEESPNYR